jgi:hypothetical protein
VASLMFEWRVLTYSLRKDLRLMQVLCVVCVSTRVWFEQVVAQLQSNPPPVFDSQVYVNPCEIAQAQS